MKTIAIFFGGKSVEHDISVITALQMMELLKDKYEILPVYIKTNGQMCTADNLSDKEVFLDYQNRVRKEKEILLPFGKNEIWVCQKNKITKKINLEAALLCCHGGAGENGCLQGALELADICYTSPDHYSSAICMDKVLTKIVLEKNGIQTAKYVKVDKCEFETNRRSVVEKIRTELPGKTIIKPAKGGSSVGVCICQDADGIEDKLDYAFQFDDCVIVEEFIENAEEYFCATLKIGQDIFESKVDAVQTGNVFSFEEKYIQDKRTKQKQVSAKMKERVTCLAKETVKALGCDGVVRVDFLYQTETDSLFVGEVNTIPGSLAFHLFDLSSRDFVQALIFGAKKKHQTKQQLMYQFSSSAIERFISLSNNSKLKIK